MNYRHTALFIIIACLTLASCTQRKDLVGKAFEDKNFDRMLEKADPPAEPKDEEEDERTETETTVLVDQLQREVEGEGVSTFEKTGKTDHPSPKTFKNDPVAPAINLEEAKLYDVIHALLTELDLPYLIDPAVQDQSITISMPETDTDFKTSELLDLLLKLHDLTLVYRDPFYFVVPLDSVEAIPGLELLYGNKPNPNLYREEVVIQLVPLKYVRPADMSAVIKEFLSSSARILEEPKNNILIIIDKAIFIEKAMELIPIFDVDVLANKKMVLYQLAHVDAVETATKLQEILGIYGYENDGERLSVISIESLNGILVVSNSNQIFKEINFWIDKFDQEASIEEEQVFVYQVQNTTADNLAATLGQLFGLQGGGFGGRGNINSGASSRRTTSPTLNASDNNNRTAPGGGTAGQTNTGTNTGVSSGARGGGVSAMNSETMSMIVDEDNNMLIFNTTPREFYRIRRTLEKIDILPRQVFLEVTVLSVQLNDATSVGVKWGGFFNGAAITEDDPVTDQRDTLNFASGLNGTYSYTGTASVIAAQLSLAKTKGYVNVLQQPHIMAIDNKSASISVGTDVPIITATNNINNVAGGGALNPVSSSTIQYRNTGVGLAFTPHINANGVIRLEINLDISEAGDPNPQGGTPISQRNLSTEMIVRDNQTVVMGGLIFDQESWSRNSVPFLERIPLIKHLVTDRNGNSSKSELVVMITPRLIDNEEKSIQISKEFKDKILKEFESFRSKMN